MGAELLRKLGELFDQIEKDWAFKEEAQRKAKQRDWAVKVHMVFYHSNAVCTTHQEWLLGKSDRLPLFSEITKPVKFDKCECSEEVIFNDPYLEHPKKQTTKKSTP